MQSRENTLYPQAYIQYLVHFHGTRDFFECHEIMEEHWLDNSKEGIWLALIQIAVSQYHFRRDNRIGALRMMESALGHLQIHSLEPLGLAHEETIALMEQMIDRIKNNKAYMDMVLPIFDQNLLNTCNQLCSSIGCIWGGISDMEDLFLIHKHKLRDRTDIILQREKRLLSADNNSMC